MNKLTHLALGLGLVGTLLAASTEASANCNVMSDGTDRELWNNHGGCWPDFARWSVKAYNMNHDDWGTRGWDNGCDLNRELAKHWNASYLINKGITFSMGFAGRALHSGSADYTEVGRGRESDEWHDEFRHQAVDVLGNNALARFNIRPTLINLVQTSCELYDNARSARGIFNNPAYRASDYVHEGWHMWKDEHGIVSDHYSGGRDMFYPHARNDYNEGELHIEKRGHARSHSVNQAQFEALCDIADMGSPRIPLNVRLSAQLFTTPAQGPGNEFLSPVPFVCGSALLVAGPPPGTPPPTSCSTPGKPFCASPAACTGICGTDSCCYVIR